jgi:hypothetical protein
MYQLDHIIIAAPDLGEAISNFETRTGTSPVHGGQHVGLGTRNALVSFGAPSYLEIIAPDPDQNIEGTFASNMAALREPQLLHWAIRVDGLESVAQRARDAGLTPGEIRRTSRAQPDGQMLEWELMGIVDHDLGGLMPFYIDWLDCPHPSTTSPTVGALTTCRVNLPPRHPAHALLDPAPGGIEIGSGDPSLSITFESERGPVTHHAEHPIGFRM